MGSPLAGETVGGMRFTNVTLEAGITHTHTPPKEVFETVEPSTMAGGAVAEDFDNDGWVDLFVLQGGEEPGVLYMNRRDGTFADETAQRGAELRSMLSAGAAAADFDNDGDIDIVVANHMSPHALLLNDGSGHFTLDTTMLTEPRLFASSPSWGDIDIDGLLELVLGAWVPGVGANYEGAAGAEDETAGPHVLWLYRNSAGRLSAQHLSSSAAEDRWVFAPRFADLNGDRLADLAVVSDFGTSRLYLNRGEGRFEDVTKAAGVGTDENGMGSAIGDYDNDGALDWFVSSIFDDSGTVEGTWGVTGNRLYRNRGDGSFEDVTDLAGVRDGNFGWAASFGDLDNDGDLDLFHVNGWRHISPKFRGQPARLFENLGSGTFAEVATAVGADGGSGQGRGTVLFDYDNDGDLDIFVTNNQELVPDGEFLAARPGVPVLLRNDTDNGNHWLKVTLDGEPPLHHNGIGSRVYVTAGGVEQMRELHASTNYVAQEPGRIAHFGVGRATVVDQVWAEWVTGDATVLTGVSVDQQLSVPSPRATVSSRTVPVGQDVTASAGDHATLTGPVYWLVEGEVMRDPVTVSFDTPGPKQLRLDLYSADGRTRLRSELLRLTVVAAE